MKERVGRNYPEVREEEIKHFPERLGRKIDGCAKQRQVAREREGERKSS